MKKYLFCVIIFTAACADSIDVVGFDVSMGKGSKDYNQCIKDLGRFPFAIRPATALLDVFRTLYERNNFSKVVPAEQPKIPKIFHHIWVGGQFPEEYKRFRQTWLNKHPDWLFIFWTDNPVNFKEGEIVLHTAHELQSYLYAPSFEHKKVVVDVKALPLYNQSFYDQTVNPGEKSDLLKWEIVYRYGGVYVDTDFECLKSIDIFNHCYDFYVGIQPLDITVLALGAGLFGAVPGNEILKHCIENLKNYRGYREPWQKTGPIPFTRSFFEIAPTCTDCVIALPPTYFYPIGFEQKQYLKNIERHIKPESYAVHYWAGSWIEEEE